MSRKHTQILVAKTQEIPAFSSSTFVSFAHYRDNPGVKPEPPYIVWHPAFGTNLQPAVTAPRTTKNPQFTGHVVGVDAEQVQVLMDLLEALLFPGGRGIVLNAPGERGKPLMFSCPVPIQVQTDPQPTIVYGVVEVSWLSDPV